MGLEYVVLNQQFGGYSPEEWTAVDSLAWLKAMAWDLKGNYEAELTRAGYRLEPADPATVVFNDGTELRWPSDRGEQLSALTAAYGRPVAERWRDLVDRLGGVWQALRPLGWEAELRGRRQLSRDVRQRLLGRQSLAQLGRDLAHPHLEALVRSVAYRQGSVPERTPALAAGSSAPSRRAYTATRSCKR